MKKNILLLFVLGLIPCFIVIKAENTPPKWDKAFFVNTYGSNSIQNLRSTPNGNYATIAFTGTIKLGDSTYVSDSFMDILVVKFNMTSGVQWVYQFGSPGAGIITASGLDVDQSGDVYFTYYSTGEYSYGATSSISSNKGLVKLSPAGEFQWLYPDITNSGNSKMAFGTSGNVYAISGSTLLCKLTANGGLVWQKTFPKNTLQALAVTDSALYVGGAISSSVNFDSITATNVGGYYNGYICRADLNGNFNKFFQITSSTYSSGSCISDITEINNNKLLIAGFYNKNLDLGTELKTSNGNSIYAGVCDANLNFSNVISSSTGTNVPIGLDAVRTGKDSQGNLFLWANTSFTTTFDTVTITDIAKDYVIKMDTSLNVINGFQLPKSATSGISVQSTGRVLASATNSDSDYLGNVYVNEYDNLGSEIAKFQSTGSEFGSFRIRYVQQDKDGSFYLQSYVLGRFNYFGVQMDSKVPQILISKHQPDGTMVWYKEIPSKRPAMFGNSFVLDHDGNIISSGQYTGSLDLGDTTLTSQSNSGDEGYVVKIDKNGSILWASNLGINDIGSYFNLVADYDNNVIVAVEDNPANDLIKFNASGKKLWSKRFPMQSYYIALVSVDSLNNIYLSSEIHLDDISNPYTLDMGTYQLTQSLDSGSIALFKFSPTGNPIWGKLYGGYAGAIYSDGWPTSIKTDKAGNTYIWGWCRNGDTFGSFKMQNPFNAPKNMYSYFLMKTDSLGNMDWVRPVYEKSYGFNYGDLLDLDDDGNIYVGGNSPDSISVDGTTILPENTNDFYLFKFDNTGNLIWHKTISENKLAIGRSLSSTVQGEVMVAGYYTQTSSFDALEVSPVKSGFNSFVAVLNDQTTGVNETSYENNILVYPNPTSNKLFIKGIKVKSCMITDISGRRVIDLNVTNNEIDVSGLKRGIYFVTIKTETGIFNTKMVKR